MAVSERFTVASQASESRTARRPRPVCRPQASSKERVAPLAEEHDRFVASAAVVGLVLAAAGMMIDWSGPSRVDAPAAAPLAIPAEIVALAQATRMGGTFMVEVDATGKVHAYSAEIEIAQVPQACLAAAESAAPGGKVVSAERQVIDGREYFEVEKQVDGRRLELLITAGGEVAGSEEEIGEQDAPPEVLRQPTA